MYLCVHTCASLRTMCQNCFCPSIVWVLGFKPRLPGSAENAFIHQAASLALHIWFYIGTQALHTGGSVIPEALPHGQAEAAVCASLIETLKTKMLGNSPVRKKNSALTLLCELKQTTNHKTRKQTKQKTTMPPAPHPLPTHLPIEEFGPERQKSQPLRNMFCFLGHGDTNL